VIGICKATEAEIIARLIAPLVASCRDADLTADMADKDFGRVARYCAGKTERPPEIGVISRFLMTAANSRSRTGTSVLLGHFYKLIESWPDSDWLVASDGAPSGLEELVSRFRNPAAHTAWAQPRWIELRRKRAIE
jgi:hypothetical protein